MTMLYMNDSTHEESLIEVNPSTRETYSPGFSVFAPAGEMQKLFCAGSRNIDIRFDPKCLLEHGAGCGVILTEDQVLFLRNLDAEMRAARIEAAKKVPAPSLIAQGRACYSCGRPRKVQNGECVYCGADA